MNQLVEQQLKHVRALVDELGEALTDSQLTVRDKHAAFRNLTQRYWSRGSQIAVMDQNEGEFAALREENERLRTKNREVRKRLERILACTKALSAGFRP